MTKFVSIIKQMLKTLTIPAKKLAMEAKYLILGLAADSP